MKNSIYTLIIRLYMLILILVMGGCSQITPSLNQQSTSISSNLVFTPTSSDKGQTQTKTITATKTSPAPKPTIFATKKVLLTSTLTPILTLTPLPTLSQRDSHDLIQDLLQNNGGCRLPCWWGITPGQTDWNMARQFLETFVIDINKRWEEIIVKEGSPISQAGYDISYEIDSGVETSFYVFVENGIIKEILVGGRGTQMNFRLNQLLASYGPPDEVYIKTYPVTSSGAPPPFGLTLYYGQSHFWAHFDMDGEIVGEIVRACPQSVNPLIWLGSPAREWTLDDLSHFVYGPPIPIDPEYLPLTLLEATGMDLESFTNTFKDPDQNSCLETPADLWH